MTFPASDTSSVHDTAAGFARALAGQYELVREIGRGGMGVVYLARDVKLDRAVAIKTLPPHLAGDPTVRERFLREGRTAAAFSHPNIVPIHRADELDGYVFFVMGFVDGESIAQCVRERGPLAPVDLVHHFLDITAALGYAHQRGVIHRDVKAENILIERASGRAVVTDFGIARLAEAAPLTATGQVLGTVYYLSPEQVSGDPIDQRSDIYSLGVCAFFALSGRFPFDAELASAVLVAHVTKEPPALRDVAPDVPVELAAVIDRCLAKDRGARFPDCGALHQALQAAASAIAGDDERRTSARPAESAFLSDGEARHVIDRAAQLQAVTGLNARVPIEPLPADRGRATETSGHRVANVRAAAAEAGIDAKYVDRALADHGLVPGRTVAPPPPGADPLHPAVVDRSAAPNGFAGTPLELVFEIVLDGEVPASDYDLFVELMRDFAGETGRVTEVGRRLAWESSSATQHLERPSGPLRLVIVPRDGTTTIRLLDNRKALTTLWTLGPMALAAGLSTPAAAALGVMYRVPGVAEFACVAAVTVATWIGVRGTLAVATRARSAKLRSLAESLARQARASIAKVQTSVAPAEEPRRLSRRT